MIGSRDPGKIRDGVVLGLCSVILAAGSRFELEDDRLKVGEAAMPSVCWARGVFDDGCPGCGLTRSVVAFCGFRLSESIDLHSAGFLVGTVVLVQCVYRLVCVLWKRGGGVGVWVSGASRYVMLAVLIVSLARGLGRIHN